MIDWERFRVRFVPTTERPRVWAILAGERRSRQVVDVRPGSARHAAPGRDATAANAPAVDQASFLHTAPSGVQIRTWLRPPCFAA